MGSASLGAVQPQPPHALTAKQTAVLRHLLRHDRPGFDVLRSQLAHARVTRYWYEPSASFDMEVVGGVSTRLADGMYADAEWGWLADNGPEGNLIVWVEHGRLAALEYAVVADGCPGELPDVARIREPPGRPRPRPAEPQWPR